MSGPGSVTSGGHSGASGGRRVWVAGCALIGMFVTLHTIVNSSSLIDEFARDGDKVPHWVPWTLEISSAIAWLIAMPLIAVAALRLRPPRLSWPATIVAHLLLTVAVSLIHVTIMVELRELAYALRGVDYRFGSDLAATFVYEWRKDAVDYVTLALAFLTIDWLAGRAENELAPAPAGGPKRIEIRVGSRTTWLAPDDIVWAEAAGNYVELHTADGSLLHRSTLAALERELAPHGFARIHRSRLVRREAVREVETNASGDFDATLANGARVSGSRRYRAALEA
jgi:DNA-binding LytR/AlgR family response regulator